MLHFIALYPQLMTFEELHCLHLRGQAIQEVLNCVTLKIKRIFDTNLPVGTAQHDIIQLFNYSAKTPGSFYLNREYYEAYVLQDILLLESQSLIDKYHNYNTLRTGLLNCLNARSRGLNFRHRSSCM